MFFKYNKIKALCALALLGCQLTAFAQPNPASQDWAVPSLYPKNWNDVCQSGSITGLRGCYGNVSSPVFSILNRGLFGLTNLFGIHVVNAPNSIFIQQFFAGSSYPQPTTPTDYTDVLIYNNSANMAKCAVFDAQGLSVGANGVDNCILASGTVSPAIIRSGGIAYEAYGPNSHNDNLYFRKCASDGVNGTNITSPIYVVCLGVDTAGNAASIEGLYAIDD